MFGAVSRWRVGRGPTVLVLGAGAANIAATNGSEEGLDQHRRNLTRYGVKCRM